MKREKFNAVISLDAPVRYSHFIKTAADRRVVWGLWADSWLLRALDDDNAMVFPIWPEKEYAEFFAESEKLEYEPSEIDIHDLLDELIPKLIQSGIETIVFPVPGSGGILPGMKILENDLRTELSRIE